MVNNCIWLVIVAVCYFMLFVFIPFWLRGFRLSGENVMDNLVSSFLYSNVIIILSVCVLSLIGIYYWYTITLLLIIIAILYRIISKGRQALGISRIKQTILDIADGYYHPRVLLGHLLGRYKLFLKSLKYKVKNPVGFLFTVGIFGYGMYTHSYHSIVNMFFGSSDMYVHTEWIKYLMHNQPFIGGVYPFGFQSVVAAVSSVFHINVVTVMQMVGPISGMLVIFALYYVLRRSMYSAFAVNTALALYVVTDLFPFWATERQFLALPQEFGTIFLYLTAYYLYIYLRDKKLHDLICFSTSVSLTLLIHFYVTVFAVIICAMAFFVSVFRLNFKALLQIAAGVLCALLIAVSPLGLGLLKGIELNNSIGWALSFIAGDETSGEDVSETEGGADEKITYTSIVDMYDHLQNAGNFDTRYDESLLNARWFVPYLIAAVIASLIPLLKFRNRRRQWMLMVFSGYTLALCFILILSLLNIFSLMEDSRIYAFFIYSVPLVICAPFEFLYLILSGTKENIRISYIVIISVVTGAGIFYIGDYQRFMPLGRVWQSQYNGAVTAYYNIMKQFPKNNWIIVSSMTEYTLCLFEGYHYEMAEFILDMNDYNGNSELYLPAENIFIYVVKRPNTYLSTDLQYLGRMEALPEFNEMDAFVDLEDTFDIDKDKNLIDIYENFDANHVLQAKAHAWSMEYIKYYPKEMTIFYEDDEIIVYRIKQNPYALNNFSISYIGNQE